MLDMENEGDEPSKEVCRVMELELDRRPGVYVELSALAFAKIPPIFQRRNSEPLSGFKAPQVRYSSDFLCLYWTFEDKMATTASAPANAGNAAFKVCGGKCSLNMFLGDRSLTTF